VNRKFTATGAGGEGAVCLRRANIVGGLFCDGAELANLSGPALNAAGLRVDGNVSLNLGFVATGAGQEGVVRLYGARNNGGLLCDRAN